MRMFITCVGYTVCVGFKHSAVGCRPSALLQKLNLAVPTVYDNSQRLAPRRPKSFPQLEMLD